MQALLSLFAALAWGSGNFTMSIAGRRSSPRATVLIGFAAGLSGSLIFFLLQAPSWSEKSLTWGILAGVSQGIGWMAFSRGLYLGPISIVAPLAAATTTVALYVYGMLRQGSFNVVSVLGGLIALAAIVLLSRWRREGSEQRDAIGTHNKPFSGVLLALAAGLMFTLQSLALNEAGTHSSSTVVLGAGLGVVVIVCLSLVASPIPKVDFIKGGAIAGVGGLIIFGGDVSYLYALNHGPLTRASVLGQLHPLFTVALALIVLRERISKSIQMAILMAFVGSVLIAIG